MDEVEDSRMVSQTKFKSQLASGQAFSALEILEVGDYIIKCLEGMGVEYVFGIPGGSIEPFYNALARAQKRKTITSVVARHETGAAFMAQGYFQESGRLGVCCATSGPGTTNLVTGVASAYVDDIPLLVITGQSALKTFGRGAFQESSEYGINVVNIFNSITHFSALVTCSEQVPHILSYALSVAMEQGPVHIAFPMDVMRSSIQGGWSNNPYPYPFLRNKILPSTVLLGQLLEHIQASKNGFILVGEKAKGSAGKLVELAERLNWKVAVTPGAKGAVCHEHALFAGVFGMAGHKSAYLSFCTSDDAPILVFGSNLDEIDSLGWNEKTVCSSRVIHIDAKFSVVSKSYKAKLRVLGDIDMIVQYLLEKIQTKVDYDQSSCSVLMADLAVDKYMNTKPLNISDVKRNALSDQGLHPKEAIAYLEYLCPAHTRCYFDTGTCCYWAVHCWHQTQKRIAVRSQRDLFRVPMKFASMGWAIGAAIGAALAARDVPILCVTGDGSYLMSGAEITVAQELRLNIVFVIWNDSALGSVKHGQRLSNAERIAFELPDYDYAQHAKCLGVQSMRVESIEDLKSSSLEVCFRSPGPILLDFVIDSEQTPPMNSRVAVLNDDI